jgi:hypothetical protein
MVFTYISQKEIGLLYIFVNYSLNDFHLEIQQEIGLLYIFVNSSLRDTTRNSFITYVC